MCVVAEGFSGEGPVSSLMSDYPAIIIDIIEAHCYDFRYIVINGFEHSRSKQ